MPNDPSANDPKAIWQKQTREVSTVTLEKLIRWRAQELHARALRERFGTLVAPIAVAVLFSVGASAGSGLAESAAFAIAMAWSLAGTYVLNRGAWPAKLAGDAGLDSGLRFCRLEIEQLVYLHRRFMLWCFGPIVLGIIAFVIPLAGVAARDAKLANMIPFLTLAALWVIGIFVFRSRGWRALEREIEELNEIEKENRS